MELHRLFLIAALTSTFVVIGCGDDGSGGNGGGGACDVLASQACVGGACDISAPSKASCEQFYSQCVDNGGSCDDCDSVVRMWCASSE